MVKWLKKWATNKFQTFVSALNQMVEIIFSKELTNGWTNMALRTHILWTSFFTFCIVAIGYVLIHNNIMSGELRSLIQSFWIENKIVTFTIVFLSGIIANEIACKITKAKLPLYAYVGVLLSILFSMYYALGKRVVKSV